MFNTKDKKLVAYIIDKLEREQTHTFYNPDGNSQRAMLNRRMDSYFKSLKWHAKDFLEDYIYCAKSLGVRTEIGELFSFIYCTLLFPIAPFIKEFFAVRSAVKAYRREYDQEIKITGS